MLNWYASSLTSDKEAGLGDREIGHIAALLKTGVSPRATVFGPMAEVVYGSLQHLSDTDIRAMAIYLKSLPQNEAPPPGPALPEPAAEKTAMLAQGGKLYEKHCADCHCADGRGRGNDAGQPVYPPLAGNRALMAANPVRMVLSGGFPPGTKGNPRPYGMPPYAQQLSDGEVAAVVSYIRQSWGNQAGFVSPVEVNRYRSAPLD